jgi:hypothetical protein
MRRIWVAVLIDAITASEVHEPTRSGSQVRTKARVERGQRVHDVEVLLP